MPPPKFPLGTKVRAYWPGGKKLKEGWHPATLKAHHPGNKRYKYTVTWDHDKKDSQRTDLQVQPLHEPAGAGSAIAPLTMLNRDHRAMRAAYNNKAGMYAITAFPEKDIVKIGFAKNLGKCVHEYELYWIDHPVTLYAMLVLPNRRIAEHEENEYFHPRLRREGHPYAGRWRTDSSTEWYKKSADWERIVSMLKSIEARHKGAGAFLTLAPGETHVVPKLSEPRDVDRIVAEREDKDHGTQYRVAWKGAGREETWISSEFMGTEGRSHAILLWEARQKGGAAEVKKVKQRLKEIAEKRSGVDRAMVEQEHRLADQLRADSVKRDSAQVGRALVRSRAFALAAAAGLVYPTPAMWSDARK